MWSVSSFWSFAQDPQSRCRKPRKGSAGGQPHGFPPAPTKKADDRTQAIIRLQSVDKPEVCQRAGWMAAAT